MGWRNFLVKEMGKNSMDMKSEARGAAPPPSHKYNSGNLQRNVLMCSFIHMGFIKSI